MYGVRVEKERQGREHVTTDRAPNRRRREKGRRQKDAYKWGNTETENEKN